MKKIIFKLTGVALIATIFITGCKKDDDNVEEPVDTNTSEVMTTLKLTFVDSAGVAPNVIAQYRDPDGDGGNSPVQFDEIRLLANKTYFATVVIQDETKSPIVTISDEVIEESNDHLFFYTPTNVNATVSITDQDSNTPPLPLGINTKWRTQAVSSGTVRVVLRHQPGVKDGTYAPGETDIDLTFQAVVE
jgi:hypothetical protein